MPETHKEVMATAKETVTMLGGFFYTLHQSARVQGSAGLPDAFCFVKKDGLLVAFWFEAKTEKDKLRPEQLAFKALCSLATPPLPVVVGRAGDITDFLGL